MKDIYTKTFLCVFVPVYKLQERCSLSYVDPHYSRGRCALDLLPIDFLGVIYQTSSKVANGLHVAQLF